MVLRFIIQILIILLASIKPHAFAQNQCETYLSNKKYDIVRPLISAIQKLDLPLGLNRHESKFKPNEQEEILKSLSFFRPSLENLPGGKDLFRVFENIGNGSPDQIKEVINEWAKKYLPGYEIIFLDDVKLFKFTNFYPNKNIPIFDPETGTLHDKFLFELYANKQIPVLNVTDLVSTLLVLSAPKLRENFEKLVDLYQRSQALGDLNEDDLMFGYPKISRPYRNLNRLSYISTVMDLLISRLVFLSPYNGLRQMVLFGSQNLLATSSNLKSVDLAKALDLSLTPNKNAMDYFEEQSKLNNRSVMGLFNFLVRSKILPRPANVHMSYPTIAQQSIAEQSRHFNLVRIESRLVSDRLQDSTEQAWLRFSNFVYNDQANPITQTSRYPFRFEWIEHYIKIVESDVVSTENRSKKEQPGPLFK